MSGSDHLGPRAALGYRAPGKELEHLCLYAAAQILLSIKLWEEERKRDREIGGRQRRHSPVHTDIIGNGENDNLEFKKKAVHCQLTDSRDFVTSLSSHLKGAWYIVSAQ